jgi:hypothetical protein
MGGVADFLIAVANLVEAEGRALRRSAMRVAIGCLLVLISLSFVLFGFALLTWCVFLAVLYWVGPALAALISGIFALIVGAILVGAAKLITS